MNTYIEIRIEVTDSSLREILIAQLAEEGAEGFEEERNLLKAFIPAQHFRQTAIDEIVLQNNLNYSSTVIEEKNWNAEWESNFHPVVIDDFCAIRANFHAAVPGIQYDIIITPKMSFGTGHHATTYMMIQAMAQLNFAATTVFDFGTGTGVLSILAEKLGASSIVAIDNDSWSIENSAENFNINNCDKILLFNKIDIIKNKCFDVILANINRNTILENLVAIKQHLALKGVLLISGLLGGDQAVVLAKAEKSNLKLNNRLEKNGWICLELINNE
jgi:ribosomal protein L11 methyltransferase